MKKIMKIKTGKVARAVALSTEKSKLAVSSVLLIDRDPLRQSKAERMRAKDTLALTHDIVLA